MSSDKDTSKKSLGTMPSFRKASAKKSDAKSAAADDNDANKNNTETEKSPEKNKNTSTNKEAADDKTTEKPAKKTETRGRKRKAEADPETEKTTPAKKSKTTKKAADEAEKSPKKTPKGGKAQKGAKKAQEEDDAKLKQTKLSFSKRKSPNKKKDDDAMDVEVKNDKEGAVAMSDVDDSIEDNNFELEKEESDEEIESAEEEDEKLEPAEEPATKNRKEANSKDTNAAEKVPEEEFVVSEETPKKKETRGRPKKGEVRIPKKYVKKGRQPRVPKVWTPDNHAKEMGKIREEMKKSLDESELLFENWMPNMDELKEAVISDGKEYYPEAKPSPQFCFRTEKSESDPETLELFDVLERVKSGSNHKDLLMNVGGPVWALDWCPRSSVDEVAQYIAVSAYNSDEYHVFSKPYSGKHIIQIWSLGKLTNSGAPSKPYLALGIAHEGGFVWDLQWCPKGSVVKQKVNGKIVPRLGLLATACGDGTLRIYSVPDPEHLHKELGKAGSPLILKLKPAYEVSLPFPSLIWRCAWNPTCDKIATGCTDGTVAVFKPSDKNSKVVTNTIPPPLKPPTVDFETCLGGAKDVKDEPDEVTLSNMNTVSFLNSRKTQLTKIPIAYFTAHRTCALVQWSSEGAPRDLLVSMGDSIKFWDLRNTSCPLQQYTFGTKIANSITFGSQLSTVMCCFDDGSVRYLDPTGMSRQFVYHGASLWGGSSSSLVEHFATCDASGVVKTMPTNDCIKHARLAASTFPRPTTVERLLYEDSILKFAGSHKIAKNEYDALNELTGNDEESEEEEKPKKKSKAKAKSKKKKDDEDNDEEENEENNNNNTNEDTPNKKPKKQLLDPMRAFHRVRWNPNFSACMWLAYAGKSGLLRCQSIDWVV